MSDDLLSLRLVVVSNSTEDRDLFRQAASSVAVPVEIVTADSAASAKNEFSAGADILYVDSGLATGDRAQTIAARILLRLTQ